MKPSFRAESTARSGRRPQASVPDFVEIRPPHAEEVLVYADEVRTLLTSLVAHFAREGATPRALLFGPPGLGKTATLHRLSHDVTQVFWWVRIERVFTSFFGGTASNVWTLFSHAQAAKAVLVFDDFEVLARRRDDPRESGETKRVVASLIAALDEHATVPVLAATNLPESIDPAVIRRLDHLIPFSPLPVEPLRRLLLAHRVNRVSDPLIREARQLSPAEIVDILRNSKSRTASVITAAIRQRTHALNLSRGRNG